MASGTENSEMWLDELAKIKQMEREQAAKEWAEAAIAEREQPFIVPGTEYAGMLPDTNPKTAFGVQKPSFNCIPPVALIHLGAVCKNGAEKYGPMNWREHAVSFSVYYNAILRHLFAVLDGEWTDPESGEPHLAHVMAGAAIVLDAKANDKLNDDRPAFAGKAASYVRNK